MLTELRISNFAVIDSLNLEFGGGLHVLTGETGAGKSILVDAIALLVGGRASADQIRSDAEEAVLEAAFSLPAESSLAVRLRESGVLGPHDSEIIIRRVLSRSGRNRLYLNGSLTPLHVIQTLAGTLIDIHGQHEQQSLLSGEAQLDALDAFGHLKELRRAYAERYERWQARQRELDEAVRVAAERDSREEFLRFQHGEIEEADVKPGEEEALLAERLRLNHAERLGQLADEAYEGLYVAEASVLGMLGTVQNKLKELGAIDPAAADWTAPCDSATVQLRELAQSVRDYRQGLEHDPDRLTQVEERLDRLQRLKKKYGGTVEALLARAQEIKRDIEAMDQSEAYVAGLREQVLQEHVLASALATQLSHGRTKAAAKLEGRIKEELAALRMDRTRIKIDVARDVGDGALGSTGCDRVAYLFSANEGEPLQPLARVASGGELSRVMLAMKSVLAETDHVPVLIFDEVDAGIGGAVAAVMGRRLRALADYHQVFCITHLPQIAAQAGTHFVVEKAVVKKRTVASVKQLDRAGRESEVARMLGGVAITKSVRQTAAEMIGEAERG
ncbi:MAG: DNA repair protein RecN [Nitrospirae bacterium]|nr:MAG: DNA repair protein RecN [Nitrospirota bacterium]